MTEEKIINENTEETTAAPNPLVEMEIEQGGQTHGIVIELYPEVAPNTVNNFISLVRSGFYDGLTFHRVISGFMIQGGDPKGIGVGGPGYSIKGEFKLNGVANDLKHEVGVISMARAQHFDSAGSQFFICVADCTFLDKQYAAFGRVIANAEACVALSECETDRRDRPLEPMTIKCARVELGGVEYPEPVKLPAR